MNKEALDFFHEHEKYSWENYDCRNEKVGEKFKGDLWEHHALEFGDYYICDFLLPSGSGIRKDFNMLIDKNTLVVVAIPDINKQGYL